MRHQHLPFEITGPHTSRRRSRVNRWGVCLLALAAILGAALVMH